MVINALKGYSGLVILLFLKTLDHLLFQIKDSNLKVHNHNESTLWLKKEN